MSIIKLTLLSLLFQPSIIADLATTTRVHMAIACRLETYSVACARAVTLEIYVTFVSCEAFNEFNTLLQEFLHKYSFT